MSDHNWDPRLLDDEIEEEATVADGGGPGGPDEPSPDAEDGRSRTKDPAAPRRWWLGVVGALVIALGAGGWALFLRDGGLPDGVALSVDGEQVTVEELEAYADVLWALFGIERPADESEQDQFARDIAASRALALVVDQAAEDKDVEVTEEQVQAALDDFIAERYPEGGQAAFVQALGSRGVSEAQVRAELRRQMVSVALFERIVGDITITDEELTAAFEEVADDLRVPERRTLRHVVVATEEEARQVRDRLEAGEDFAVVVAEASLDGSTRDDGGRLGTLSRAELTAAFGDAAFEAAEGELFGPVETDLGWHVGRVDAIEPTRQRTIEEVEERLRRRLELDAALGRWRPWLAARFAQADIRYAKEFQPDDPDRLPGDEVVPLVPDVPARSTDAPDQDAPS